VGAKLFKGTMQVRQLTIQRTYGRKDVGVRKMMLMRRFWTLKKG